MKSILRVSVAIPIIALIFSLGCSNDNSNDPPITPSMNALEQSLLGKWNLKKTVYRLSSFYSMFQDSSGNYINHYDFNNNMLELTSTPTTSTGSVKYYLMRFGSDIHSMAMPVKNYDWNASNNSIYTNSSPFTFVVKLVTADSLIVDWSYLSCRMYFSKNTLTPIMNNTEVKFIGTWKKQGSTGGLDDYRIYKSNFICSHSPSYLLNGFAANDSTTIGGAPYIQSVYQWEVLFPERVNPILFSSYSTTSDMYYKITNITATSYTVQPINSTGANTGSPMTYSKVN